MTESRPCLVCGAPTTSKLGICHRTKECSAEYGRRYMADYNYLGGAVIHCISCGGEIQRSRYAKGKNAWCDRPECISLRRAKRRERLKNYHRAWAQEHGRAGVKCITCGEPLRKRKHCPKCRAAERKVWNLLVRAKARCSGSGREFSVTLNDLLPLPKVCPLLGLELAYSWRPGSQLPNAASIDRIDSTLGYVPGNVWVVSFRANTLKNNATLDELRRMVRGLEAHTRVSRDPHHTKEAGR